MAHQLRPKILSRDGGGQPAAGKPAEFVDLTPACYAQENCLIRKYNRLMATLAGADEPLLEGIADSNGNIVVPAEQLAEPVQPGQHVHLRLVSTPATLFGLLP